MNDLNYYTFYICEQNIFWIWRNFEFLKYLAGGDSDDFNNDNNDDDNNGEDNDWKNIAWEMLIIVWRTAELHLKANKIYLMALGDNLFGITWCIDQNVSFLVYGTICFFGLTFLQCIIYVSNSHFSFPYYCKYFCWRLLVNIILNTRTIKTVHL